MTSTRKRQRVVNGLIAGAALIAVLVLILVHRTSDTSSTAAPVVPSPAVPATTPTPVATRPPATPTPTPTPTRSPVVLPTDFSSAPPPVVAPPLTAPDGAPGVKTYTVQPGDWVSRISQRTGVPWDTIYAMNREQIEAVAHNHGFKNSDGGNLIFPGTTFYLPKDAKL